MFDRYEVRAVSERVTQNVNVTERRAPTDESVRLLREMEKAANDSVLKAVRVENCHIDAVIHQKREVQSCMAVFVVVYRINGERRDVRYEHNDKFGDSRQEQEAAAIGLRDALAKDVANVIASQVFGAMCKMFA